MKLKLTPLNFATAFFIVLAAVVFIFKPAGLIGDQFIRMTGTITLIYLFFAVMVFFLDMIFRNFFFNTRQLWIVELSFIAFTIVIFLLVK